MLLKTSIYSLDSESEQILIKNKEAVNNLQLDSPDIIEDVGLRNLLGRNEENDQKKIK